MPIEFTRSSAIRHRLCVSAAIAVASAADRYPIADSSISSAWTALAGGGTTLIRLTSPGISRTGFKIAQLMILFELFVLC